MLKSTSPHSINFARLAFLIISILGGIGIAMSTRDTDYRIPVWVGTFGAVVISMGMIYLEHLSRGFTLRGFSTATFGLMIGILCAWLLNLLPMRDILDYITNSPSQAATLHLLYKSITYLTLAFFGITVSLRSGQEDFAFIIPYIRFRQTNASEEVLLLDSTTVTDGRLIGLLDNGVLEGRLMLPRYVLEEVRALADSSSDGKKERGERALALLEDLQKHPEHKLFINEGDATSEEESEEQRLVQTAKLNNARIITTDDALTKSARLQGVSVMNLDETARSFMPAVNLGEKLKLTITRPGKEDHQGVGYLADGSMIVVNQGMSKMGATIDVVVVSKLQTSTGVMIFAELES